MTEFSAWSALVLVGVGFVAGFINTLAGGGSFLTLPALMLTGLPADVANATNRVGILMQSIPATRAFDARGKLERDAVLWLAAPAIAGGVVGAQAASLVPASVLKPILLTTMVVMAASFALAPRVVAPEEGTPVHPRARPASLLALFGVGLYAGFLQAGMGFLVLATLGGVLRYDLVRANAVKLFIVASLTVAAFAIFLAHGLIAWAPGLAAGLGSLAGGQVAVRVAVAVGPRPLRWVVAAAVTASVFVLALR